jgi:beta-galactosidase
LDGLVFSDHTPTPGLTEYKKAIEPVQVLCGGSKKIKIINRYDHVTLDHLNCDWSLVGDGFRKTGKKVRIPKGRRLSPKVQSVADDLQEYNQEKQSN